MENISQKYELLFSIKLCPFVRLELSGEAKNMFLKKHFVFKQYEDAINVAGEIIEMQQADKTIIQQTKYPISQNDHFLFYLEITDNSIFNVPKVDFTGFPKQVFYFSRNRAETQLKLAKYPLQQEVFRLSFESGKIPNNIKIFSPDDLAIVDVAINSTATMFAYDLSNFKSGLYTIVMTFQQAALNKTEQFYYSQSKLNSPILGVVDINNIDNSVFSKIDKDVFTVSFDGL